jgi:hypothetical protein
LQKWGTSWRKHRPRIARSRPLFSACIINFIFHSLLWYSPIHFSKNWHILQRNFLQLRQMARNAIAHLRERAEMLNHHFCAELAYQPILPFTRADQRYLLSQQSAIASPLMIEAAWGPDDANLAAS